MLAIAYHFPPIQGSSGLHRTLALARYLPEWNWATTVLTVSPNAYASSRAENRDMIPAGVDVVRAPAFDSVRHLSIRDRYLRLLALPDRWQSWIGSGVWKGLQIIRRQRPDVIYSTFPIASAHVIGLILHRLTRLPWIADFRDPMDQITYPSDPSVRSAYRWIEQRTFRHAARIFVTTPGTANMYRLRYPEYSTKISVIPNGFDPEMFPPDWQVSGQSPSPAAGRPLTLLHSGILYPSERNPLPFFRALAALKDTGDSRYTGLKVIFRGCGHERQFTDVVKELGLQDVVTFPPSLPYHQALVEMVQADALLLFQAANCNSQIPAKAYEYLYSGRPIIGITDPEGDTAKLLQSVGITSIAKLEDQDQIADTLKSALDSLRNGAMPVPGRDTVMKFSRKAATQDVAAVLDTLIARPAQTHPSEASVDGG